MDIKRVVLSAICVGLATAGWTRETFYWTGGSGNWSRSEEHTSELQSRI